MAIKIEFNFTGTWEDYEALISDLTVNEVLYKGLKAADSTASAVMIPSVALYNKLRGIVSASIPARIVDGGTTHFTGYLRNNFSISKTQRLQPVRVELVTASFLLKRKINVNLNYQNVTVTQLVTNLLTAAGITAISLPTITSIIPAFTAIAGEGGTYHEHIENLLFQYGYVGYFTFNGVFVTHKLDPASIVTGQLFDGSNCLSEIKQDKKETQVDRVEVHWHTAATLSNVVVFSDTTGAKNGFSCYIELPPGAYLGNSEEWYADLDCPEGEILAVSSLSIKFNAEPGVQVLKFEQSGKRALISIRNTTALTKIVRRLDIVAGSAVVKKDLNKSWVPLNPNPEKIETVQAQYIFSKASADNLANILGWYYRYSAFTYKVLSKTSFALGTLATVTDTGIGTQTGVIVSRKRNIQTGIIEYELDAVAEYTPAAAEAQNTYTQPTPAPGAIARMISNDPPTNNVTGLALSSADNPNGTVDVTIAWNYTQGDMPADGFLVFFKRDINTPGDIDIFSTPNRYVPASDATAYTTTLNLPTRQSGAGTLAIHYRFGVIAFGNRSIGTVAHLGGVVENPAWIDKTFASKLQFNGNNFWDLATGEMRVGGENNYLRVNPAEEKVEFHGLDLELTTSDLRTFSGTGDERHSLSHEEMSIVWRNDAEDGDPYLEVGRIGFDVKSNKVLVDKIHSLVAVPPSKTTFTGLSTHGRETSQIYKGKLYLPQDGGINMDIFNLETGLKESTFTGLSASNRETSQIYQGKLYLPQLWDTKMDIYDFAAGSKTTFTGLSDYIRRTSQIYKGKLYLPQDGGINMDIFNLETGLKESTFTGLSNHARRTSQIYQGKLYLPQFNGINMDIFNLETGLKESTFTGLSNHARNTSQIYKGKLYLPQDGNTNMDIYDFAAGSKTTFTGLSSHGRTTSQIYQGKLYLPRSTSGTPMDIFNLETGLKESTFTGLSNHARSTSQIYQGKLYLPQFDGTGMDIVTIAGLYELGAGIIESGSNGNGSYIKYSDGTMVQWGSNSNSNPVGFFDGVYSKQHNFNLPASFIDLSYTVTASASPSADSYSWVYTPQRKTTSQAGCYMWSNYNYGSSPVGVLWQAIGRWRA